MPYHALHTDIHSLLIAQWSRIPDSDSACVSTTVSIIVKSNSPMAAQRPGNRDLVRGGLGFRPGLRDGDVFHDGKRGRDL